MVSDVAAGSAAVCGRLLRLPSFTAARHVVVYAPIGNEIDPAMIAERALVSGKCLYYPHAGGACPEFLRATSVMRGERSDARLVVAAGLSSATPAVLFLVPGVAFDESGRRLGRGRGWYDRALALYPAGVRIGLAYEFQVVPVLPEGPWDVRMHAVVTDARLLACDSVRDGMPKENQP